MGKKVLFLLVAVWVVNFFCTSSLAAPTGGTDPIVEGRQWAIAAEYDYVYSRDLESSEISDGEIKEGNAAYAKISFKPSRFLALYGKAGLANFETDMDMTNGKTIEEKFAAGFYTGGGARVSIEATPRFLISIDNQFDWQNCDIDDIVYGGITATTKTGDATMWEYQVSGILSYKFDWEKVVHPIHGEYPALIPYAGAKYAIVEIDNDLTMDGPGFAAAVPPGIRKNDHNLGIIFGLDIDFTTLGGFNLNIEARFADETAVSGYVGYNF